ncbi:MAG: hypothetical protein E5W86_08655 [Mesorhizobium sp.]|nr:MAG: hypothetical protein E5W86_08655 [Mesorhizobium sp.]
MPNTPIRAAAEGVPNVNRRSALAASGVGLVAALLGAAPSKAAPAPVASRMAALEASFYLEWNKLRALEPEHGVAERRYFDERAKLVKPMKREDTPAEVEAAQKMTIGEMAEWSRRPNNARFEFDEAIRAYNKAEWAIRRRTGFTKIDRAYNRQIDRASTAANRVIRCPASTFEDLAAKARVHKVWEFDEGDIEYIMADITRIARGEGVKR